MSRWLIAAIFGILGLGVVSLAKSRYEEVVKTKEQARTEWMTKVHIPTDCKNAQNQECQKLLDVANQAFESQWQQSQVNKPN